MKSKSTMSLIIKMSIPPALSMLIQSLYNIVDSIFITKFDPDAMKAISLVFPIQNIILAIAVGIGIGINAYIAMKLGQNHLKEAENAANQGVLISIIHYFIVLVIGLLVAKPFLESFESNQKIIEYGLTYIRLIIIFSFTTIIQIALEKILQADGKMMLPMIALLGGTITNVVLDPIFIFTLDMGVFGAALATVLGQLVSTALMFYFIFSKRNRIRLSFKFKLSKNTILSIYKVGIPSIFISAIPSIMVTCMNYILVTINSLAVTTFGIYYKLQNFVYMGVSGISQGTIPLMGFAYGAKDNNRLKDIIKNALYLTTGIAVFCTVLFLVIPDALVGLFYEEEELIKGTVLFLRIASISFVFGCINYILSAFYQASQKGFLSLIITLLRQLVLIIPLAYLLSLSLDELGIYLSVLICECVTLVISTILFLRSMSQIRKKTNYKLEE